MITIRKSTNTDTQELADIWQASVVATHDFLNEEDFLELAKLVREQYLPNVEVWVAEKAGVAVGFMGMTDNNIDSLFIAPEMRGHSIGKLLLGHAMGICNDAVTVDVNEQNKQAVGFYRHMGFKQVGRSTLDDQGRPYPLLHMRWHTE